MNKRRRFGAKRRRREARLKQMWMSGMSVDAFFRRVLGHRGRPVTITGRFRTEPEPQHIPAEDLHRMRARRPHWGTGLPGIKKHLGIET